jgi:hypothetical protein
MKTPLHTPSGLPSNRENALGLSYPLSSVQGRLT